MTCPADANADGTAKQPKPRENKEPFKIDFLSPPTKTLKEASKEIFAPIGKGGSVMPVQERAEEQEEQAQRTNAAR